MKGSFLLGIRVFSNFFLIPQKTPTHILVHARNKLEKKQNIVVKTFLKKGPRKWFGQFWFLHHFLMWFLIVPPKDGFALYWKTPCGMEVTLIITLNLCNYNSFSYPLPWMKMNMTFEYGVELHFVITLWIIAWCQIRSIDG